MYMYIMDDNVREGSDAVEFLTQPVPKFVAQLREVLILGEGFVESWVRFRAQQFCGEKRNVSGFVADIQDRLEGVRAALDESDFRDLISRVCEEFAPAEALGMGSPKMDAIMRDIFLRGRDSDRLLARKALKQYRGEGKVDARDNLLCEIHKGLPHGKNKIPREIRMWMERKSASVRRQ